MDIISRTFWLCQRSAWFFAAITLVQPVLLAQNEKDLARALHIPHAEAAIPIDCSDTSAAWRSVSRVTLSKKAVVDLPPEASPPVLNATKPIAAVVQMNDPSKPASKFPKAVAGKLDSFHEQYAFQWDERKLYGYVEITEADLDSGHPKVSESGFKRSPSEAAASDLFFSTVIVDVGAPSWQRWTTEMHVHVRPPKAAPMSAMFFGRTNDEEEFHELAGEAIACPTKSGWIAKFSVVWLPYNDWHPVPGALANVRLIVPLAHARTGYVLASVVPFVLTR